MLNFFVICRVGGIHSAVYSKASPQHNRVKLHQYCCRYFTQTSERLQGSSGSAIRSIYREKIPLPFLLIVPNIFPKLYFLFQLFKYKNIFKFVSSGYRAANAKSCGTISGDFKLEVGKN
jgi:hypothetical protein